MSVFEEVYGSGVDKVPTRVHGEARAEKSLILSYRLKSNFRLVSDFKVIMSLDILPCQPPPGCFCAR